MVLLFSVSTISFAEEVKAIPLVKLKSKTEQLSKICETLKVQCGSGAAIWKRKNSTDLKLYIIDDTPQLIEFEKVNQSYERVNSWNFINYQHHSQKSMDGELADYGTEIFPAFYPLSQQNLAIALVKHWGTAYSGGGKGEQVADFLMLKPQGKFNVALDQIPFHSYEMIRACFSEKDYKTSPHCHDESASNLSIQFKDVGKLYYQWTLNYTDFTWEAFKPEKTKTIEKHSEVVMPFAQK